MKKRIRSKKLISSLAISTLVLGLFVTTVINADESEVTTEAEIQEVEEITEKNIIDEDQEVVGEDTTDEIEENTKLDIISTSEGEQINRSSLARVDLSVNAFPDSSRELELAIIAKYDGANGTIKVDTDNNGFISIEEANLWTGTVIDLNGQGLAGTITGIENFSNLSTLYLYNNQFTGTLPESLGEVTTLKLLYLQNNQLSGSIPNSIGNLLLLQRLYLSGNQFTGTIPESLGELEYLQRLYLQNNQLTGNIPDSLGNLENLQYLNLYNNQLTGSIPATLGNLSSLVELFLFNNQLSGEIPSEIGNISTLLDFVIFGNKDLTGNVAEIFNGHTSLRILITYNTSVSIIKPDVNSLQVHIYNLMNNKNDNVNEGLTQEHIDSQRDSIENLITIKIVTVGSGDHWDILIGELNSEINLVESIIPANDKVDSLFNDDKTNLATNISQEDINTALNVVNDIEDGPAKERLLEEIHLAQNILNAKTAVEDLFTDGSHTDIPDDLTQTDIDKAQELVDKVLDGKLKDELQKEIDKAQDMLNARDKVNNLFTDDAHTDIPDNLTQTDIDDAQKAVDKLPSGDLKDELQKEIDKAQNMLDAKDKVDNLFTDDTHTDITDGLTQKDIDKAQDAVDKLPDGTLKDELQKEIEKAQDMLNAKDVVGDLLDKDGNLNSGVTQEDINKAQDLVNKLPDGDLKDELQAIIDEAQRQLDTQNVKNPSTAPTTNKPSLAATSTTGGDNVNTADITNLSLYLGLLAISLGGIVIIKRRKTESK